MNVCVLTRDLMFFGAVEGVAGAMGHRATQATALEEVQPHDLLIADMASVSLPVTQMTSSHDPLRTAAFIPHVDVDRFAEARSGGLAHVYRRGSLAVELPRFLAECAG